MTDWPGGSDTVEEAICPFCSKPVRSDAGAPAFCGLCGMGIDLLEDAPCITREDGDTVFFCCLECLSVYERCRSHGRADVARASDAVSGPGNKE